MLYKIKNIKDELNIKIEINILVILWLIFSMIYFVTNTIYDKQKHDAYEDLESLDTLSRAQVWIIFSAIMLRNLSSIFVSTLFVYLVIKNSDLHYPADYESPHIVFDFDLVLESVLPQTYF